MTLVQHQVQLSHYRCADADLFVMHSVLSCIKDAFDSIKMCSLSDLQCFCSLLNSVALLGTTFQPFSLVSWYSFIFLITHFDHILVTPLLVPSSFNRLSFIALTHIHYRCDSFLLSIHSRLVVPYMELFLVLFLSIQ